MAPSGPTRASPRMAGTWTTRVTSSFRVRDNRSRQFRNNGNPSLTAGVFVCALIPERPHLGEPIRRLFGGVTQGRDACLFAARHQTDRKGTLAAPTGPPDHLAGELLVHRDVVERSETVLQALELPLEPAQPLVRLP